MTNSQKLALRASEIRQRLNDIAGLEGDAYTSEIQTENDTLQSEYRSVEERSRAAIIAEADEAKAAEKLFTGTDGEGAELRSLSRRVRVGEYIRGAIAGSEVRGAESEFNQALKMRKPFSFPLRLLAPEIRTTTDADAGAQQGSWLDRLFADTAAMRLGVTFESAAAGLKAHPVMSAASATPIKAIQRGRAEAIPDQNFNLTVTELSPIRMGTKTTVSMEDDYRVAGLESAARRELANAAVHDRDLAIFEGDSGANENRADIVGLNTAANVVAASLAVADIAKGPESLALFTGLVDGISASSLADLRVISTVGAYRQWANTIHNSGADNQTVAAFLMAAGLPGWMARGDIETAYATGDRIGYVGLGRGIEGAAVACLWGNDSTLIRDPYTKAAEGQTVLTLNIHWDFKLPRPTNFARLAVA